jgi:anti-anti-sigma regulatory factor
MNKEKESVLGSDPLEWMAESVSKTHTRQRIIDQTTPHPTGEENMAKQTETLSDSTLIKLPAQFTIGEVAAVHERFLESIKSSDAIKLDASEVVKVDGAAMQLMAALFVTAKTAHLQLCWEKSSDVLQDAAKLLGLLPLFEAGCQ